MKRNILFAFVAAAFLVASCSAEEKTESNEETGNTKEEVAEAVTYSLDTDQSTLTWKGTEGEHEFHVGTIDFSKGSLTMKGDKVSEGMFVVDMSSITVTDEGMSDKGKARLTGHLGADDVFNIAQYATTTVSLGEYNKGMLDITLNVVGKEVTSRVPVRVTSDDEGAAISGNFTIDFSSAGIPLFKPKDEADESISPIIHFRLNAVLVK